MFYITDHGIGKCCSPTICKTDIEFLTTDEGIAESCRFRLEKCSQRSDTTRWK